jgi:hypothetical protein
MPFLPNSSEFSKNNACNIIHMAVLIFLRISRFEKKCLFSDKLLGERVLFFKTRWVLQGHHPHDIPCN